MFSALSSMISQYMQLRSNAKPMPGVVTLLERHRRINLHFAREGKYRAIYGDDFAGIDFNTGRVILWRKTSIPAVPHKPLI